MTTHAIQRARERFGLDLTEQDIRDVASRLAAGKGVLLSRQGCQEVHLVEVCGRAIRTVWDPATWAVLTFLPGGRNPPANPRRYRKHKRGYR